MACASATANPFKLPRSKLPPEPYTNIDHSWPNGYGVLIGPIDTKPQRQEIVWRQDGFGPAPWHRLGCQLLQCGLGSQQLKHLLGRHISRKLVTAFFVTGEDGGPRDDDRCSQGRHAAVIAPGLV